MNGCFSRLRLALTTRLKLDEAEYRILWINSQLASLDVTEKQIQAERARLIKERETWQARRHRLGIKRTFGM